MAREQVILEFPIITDLPRNARNEPEWGVALSMKVTRGDNSMGLVEQAAIIRDDDGKEIASIDRYFGGIDFVVNVKGNRYVFQMKDAIKQFLSKERELRKVRREPLRK